MNLRFTLSSIAVASVGVFLACSSESTSSPGASSSGSAGSSGGSPTLSTAECSTRCKAKLGACGAPSSQSEQGCAQLCGGSITEAQATCFENADCEDIAAAESVDDLCPKSSGSSGTSGSSGSSGSSGTNGGLPTSLTITGRFGSVKAIHVKGDDDDIASNINVAPEPSFDPSQPSTLPNVAGEGVSAKIESPDPGNCKANISYVLSLSQVGVSVTGVDALPDTDCVTFTDEIASDGIKATLTNVPYPNSSTKATVRIDLKP